MKKSEFSETQFVIGYLRELFPSKFAFPPFFLFHAPSTREEKKWASDIILKHFRLGYRYSEFYQFKRSKYFKKETFSDLKGKIVIDTSISPKYGFKIYNTKKTRQFNVLKRLASQPKKKVYYCAPAFHTIKEFNKYFLSSTVHANSVVIDLSQPIFQTSRIPLDSNHQILFDRTDTYICSDPIRIEGVFADKRRIDETSNTEILDLESEIKELYLWCINELKNEKLDDDFLEPEMNFFEVHDLLVSYFNIYWCPFLEPKQ